MESLFWGPYVSNRQWGTVREDTSLEGNSWHSFTFNDASKGKPYRFGYDGLLGFCDTSGTIACGLGVWNGRDDILKERLFGLSGIEGNHGEDMKELLYYLDGLPNHSYMKALYKYPQNEFPYQELILENQERGLQDEEFELTDTGIFDDNEYFDIMVEYGQDLDVEKSLVCCYTITNRSKNQANLTLAPRFCYFPKHDDLYLQKLDVSEDTVEIYTYEFDEFQVNLSHESKKAISKEITFMTEDQTFSDYVCKEPDEDYSRFKSFCYKLEMKLDPCESVEIFWSLYPSNTSATQTPKEIITQKRKEADIFYSKIIPEVFSQQECLVSRQAFAGLLWNKQIYKYHVRNWYKELDNILKCRYIPAFDEISSYKEFRENTDYYVDSDFSNCDLPSRVCLRKCIAGRQQLQNVDNDDDWYILQRNKDWHHVNCNDIIAVPDKWEFPWFASWDTAFQMIPYARIDPLFAKDQLQLFLKDRYLHPNGQMPGCEWDMSEPTPPVYAWSVHKVFTLAGDLDFKFLQECFSKLQKNFQWWLTEKRYREERHLFTGGFLGMDNISIFDRSYLIKKGRALKQADGTGWMAFFSLSMLEISMLLSKRPEADNKFIRASLDYLNKFIKISEALNASIQDGGLWHPHEKFYYDVLECPSGNYIPISARSLVGVVPIFACLVIEKTKLTSCEKHRNLQKQLDRLVMQKSPYVCVNMDGDYLLCAVPRDRLQQILHYLLDEKEFLSSYGIRSLSKIYKADPYILRVTGDMREHLKLKEEVTELKMTFAPAESDTDMFGGNSNWKGPVWLCMNFMIVETLLKLHRFYGNNLYINCPSYSTSLCTLDKVMEEISRRIVKIFMTDGKSGSRPCNGSCKKYSEDDTWRDLVLFYEFFDGDTGRGCGACHQTGWTALVVEFLHLCSLKKKKHE